MKKTELQKEYNSILGRYKEVRSLCDSYLKEIDNYKFVVMRLQSKIDELLKQNRELVNDINNRNRIS